MGCIWVYPKNVGTPDTPSILMVDHQKNMLDHFVASQIQPWITLVTIENIRTLWNYMKLQWTRNMKKNTVPNGRWWLLGSTPEETDRGWPAFRLWCEVATQATLKQASHMVFSSWNDGCVELLWMNTIPTNNKIVQYSSMSDGKSITRYVNAWSAKKERVLPF